MRVLSQKKYSYSGITFDSSWELAYYIFNKEHNVIIEYQPNIKFQYEYDGITHQYFPDFKVNNEIIEIKGTQYFENGDVNGKMICPYKQNKYEKQYIDGLFEAKHQCMIQNGVKIITEIEMKPILKYIRQKYGRKYLKKFKNSNYASDINNSK